MKTSISGEALSHLGAEKIPLPPKPDGLTDMGTDGHTEGRILVVIE